MLYTPANSFNPLLAVNGNAKLAQSLESAIAWFITSGIQSVSADPEIDGGYACWYEQDTQGSPYLYSEITGYMLTMMSWLYARTAESRYLNSAIRAADWLIENVHEQTGGYRCLFPLRPSRFEHKRDQIYTFDGGIILSGLVNVYRATRQAKYLAAAVTLADWMIRDAQQDSGAFMPVYDIGKRDFMQSASEWSLAPGSYHTKIAIGLINLYDATQQQRYLRAATRACDFALTFQQPSGRFISFQEDGGTNSHPHSYSAEGLWVVGKYLGREDYLHASARAATWLFSVQSPEGYVPRHYHNGEALYNERVDVLSQALRLGEIHRAEGRLTADIDPQMDALVPIIQRNQATSDDRRVSGAFYFGRLSNGDIVPHANVWVTAFAVQALLLRDDRLHGRFDFDPLFMV